MVGTKTRRDDTRWSERAVGRDAPGLARSGALYEGTLTGIIAFAMAHHEQVYLPELLRARGEQRENAEPEAAARNYREAIELAQKMGARSLEVRAAESLAAVTAGDTRQPRDLQRGRRSPRGPPR